MRRVVVLALLLPLLVLVQAGPATAGVSCHQINAKGAGRGAPPQAGDPPGLIRTVAQIRGGGLLQGTTEAAFQVTGVTPTGIAFAGDLTFTTNRATLTVDLDGTLDLATGEFSASGDVSRGHRQARRCDRHAHSCGSAGPARPCRQLHRDCVRRDLRRPRRERRAVARRRCHRPLNFQPSPGRPQDPDRAGSPLVRASTRDAARWCGTGRPARYQSSARPRGP